MRATNLMLCLIAVMLTSALSVASARAGTPQEEALALLQKGKDAKGAQARIALFTQAIDMNQSVAEALYMRGMEYYQLGQHDAAIKDFAEAVRIYPAYPDALNAHAMARYAQGAFADAWTYVDRAIQLRPDDPQMHLNRGLAAQEVGRLDLAITDFEFVRVKEPRNAFVHLCLGRALVANKRAAAALEPLTTAIGLDPKMAQAYFWRSVAHLQQHDHGAMLADLDLAIAADPKLVEAWALRGFAKNLIDGLHGNKGAEDYAKAIKLAPLNGDLWFKRAEFNSGATPPRTALVIADCKQAIKVGFDVGKASTLMGEAYLRGGKPKEAVAAFEAAKQALLKTAPQAGTEYLDGRIAASRALLDAPPPPRRADLLGDWGIYEVKELQLAYRLAANGTGAVRGSPVTWTLADDQLTLVRKDAAPEVFSVEVEAGVLTLYSVVGSGPTRHCLRMGKAWPAASDSKALVGRWQPEDQVSGEEAPIYRLALAQDGTGAFDQDRAFTWQADAASLTLTFPDGHVEVHRYAVIANGGALLLELPELTLILSLMPTP